MVIIFGSLSLVLVESMVKYIQKVVEKNQVKKEAIFHEKTRKYIQILLKFYFETIDPSIGFIVNQLQNSKTLE
jgi:hypothetical protein